MEQIELSILGRKHMKNNECTILVMGRNVTLKQCYISSYLFRKYWKDCPYEYVLCTQTQAPDPNLYDRVIYTDEDMIWGERLDNALKRIETEYVLLMQEDFFLKAYVNSGQVEECISFCRQQNGGLVRLNPPAWYTESYNTEYDVIKQDSIYRICGQPSIFSKEYLQIYAKEHYSPWQFERQGSILSKQYSNPLFVVKTPVYDCVHAWRGGKWTREAYRLMKRENIKSDLYEGDKIYPWYTAIKDYICMFIILLAPKTIMKIRSRQCAKDERRLRK